MRKAKKAAFYYWALPGGGKAPSLIEQTPEAAAADLQRALDTRCRVAREVFDSPNHVTGLVAWGDSELLYSVAANVDPRKGQTHYFDTAAEAVAFAQGTA